MIDFSPVWFSFLIEGEQYSKLFPFLLLTVKVCEIFKTVNILLKKVGPTELLIDQSRNIPAVVKIPKCTQLRTCNVS